MGAYEMPATCPWDPDCDAVVGIIDLLVLLGAWGTDPGGPPDFDGDGTVGIADLLALLAAWGRAHSAARGLASDTNGRHNARVSPTDRGAYDCRNAPS